MRKGACGGGEKTSFHFMSGPKAGFQPGEVSRVISCCYPPEQPDRRTTERLEHTPRLHSSFLSFRALFFFLSGSNPHPLTRLCGEILEGGVSQANTRLMLAFSFPRSIPP